MDINRINQLQQLTQAEAPKNNEKTNDEIMSFRKSFPRL